VWGVFYLEGKIGDRQPGGSTQLASQGGAELRHAHWVGRRRVVDPREGLVLQRLNVHVHQIVPAQPPHRLTSECDLLIANLRTIFCLDGLER
jgi:hypothetical protein